MKISALVLLTYVLFNAKLQLLAFHLLNFLIVEFVPVAGTSILHMGNVVARVGTDASMDQHCTQFINQLLVWRNSAECQYISFSQSHQQKMSPVDGGYRQRSSVLPRKY